nr:VP4 [Tibet orbivirus]
MPEPHAVIYVTKELLPLIENSYLPIWYLSGKESINELWLENGKFAADVYAYGLINQWSYRQLRGHGFIFVSTQKKIQLSDVLMDVDVRVSKKITAERDVKAFESEIGRRRLRMRKNFGDILRDYAFRNAVVFHGSEAETLNDANPRLHKVCGLPEQPPYYDDYTARFEPFPDSATDEKLVSMLDYALYSAEEVHYVGAGDLRTLFKFKQRSEGRFKRVIWHVYDTILPTHVESNVYNHRHYVDRPKDMLQYMNMTKRVERILIWDVSSDRGEQTDDEWDRTRFAEDRLGEEIAMEMSGTFSMAIIKHRIPFREQYNCISSFLIPQPAAPKTMYELRNVMLLRGYSHVDRKHIPQAKIMSVQSHLAQKMVELYHGIDRGKRLKKMLFEWLHIEHVNGLYYEGEEARADLFYLTNSLNHRDWGRIKKVLRTSMIGTLWCGRTQLYDYDDFVVERPKAMLELSYRDVRVMDGNGAILFLIWKHSEIYKRGLNYDPAWAQNFIVTLREPIPNPPVPDISLCRFIGLRVESSLLRVRNPTMHEVADELKKLGLDLSGHLYVTLMSGSYVADLMWWFEMILKWSSLGAEEKKAQLRSSGAEVIEWKDQMADKPWHVKNDLIAALREYQYKMARREPVQVQSWIDLLRDL